MQGRNKVRYHWPQSRGRFPDEALLHDDSNAIPFICCILSGTRALSVLRFGDGADGGEREKSYGLNLENGHKLIPSTWIILAVINLTIIGLREQLSRRADMTVERSKEHGQIRTLQIS